MPAKDAGDVAASPGPTTVPRAPDAAAPGPGPESGRSTKDDAPDAAGTAPADAKGVDKKAGKKAAKKTGKKIGKKAGKRDKAASGDTPDKPTRKRGRKRLRKGKKTEPEEPLETVTLTVRGLPEPVQVRKGGNLLKVSKEANLNMFWGPWAQAFNCRGKGYCNLCRVEVLAGAENLTPPTKREKKRLADRPDSWRLACTTKIEGPVELDAFPVRDPDKVARPEAIRRALLSPEEREEQRRNRLEAAKAARAEKRAADAPADKKPGLLARLTKKKEGDDAAGDEGGDKKAKRQKKGKKDKADKKADKKPDKKAPKPDKKAKGRQKK